MPLKRVAVCSVAFLLSLGLATAAQAKTFSLTGGGGQSHIGNGLALPVKAAAGPATTTTMFPTLLVPIKPAQTVMGTVAKPLLTAMGTPSGPVTKSGYQRAFTVPAGVLSKPAAQKTVGVKFSNPTVYAVGTNLKFTWPAAAAVFSTGMAVPTTTVAGFGGTMTYTNTLGARFGGAGSFRITGSPGGIIPAPVTVYIKIGAGTPPCTHPAFAGTAGKATCIAGILHALPGATATPAVGAIGGAFPGTVMTVGGIVPGMNVAVVKMGAVPLGTILAKALAATAVLPTNMASSKNGPWTTGQVIIANPAAGGGGETFTLSGKDSRTAGGAGTIQMVAGSVSARMASGANANRGWVRLILGPDGAAVPSMSMPGLVATVALILLGFGYATRRRMFA
jgi:hypothetical protein